ncbi:hypothetical protein IGK67_002309 [Enterococcus sp. AZ093]|uniref:Uncharacterized protein n=1 Tax=Enterococcus mundtii TaxID=53346 RepID=A0AAI8R8F8_ENTMU|nr:uncharacterized protein EM151A_0953 [Enterococcus mundtii]
MPEKNLTIPNVFLLQNEAKFNIDMDNYLNLILTNDVLSQIEISEGDIALVKKQQAFKIKS